MLSLPPREVLSLERDFLLELDLSRSLDESRFLPLAFRLFGEEELEDLTSFLEGFLTDLLGEEELEDPSSFLEEFLSDLLGGEELEDLSSFL